MPGIDCIAMAIWLGLHRPPEPEGRWPEPRRIWIAWFSKSVLPPPRLCLLRIAGPYNSMSPATCNGFLEARAPKPPATPVIDEPPTPPPKFLLYRLIILNWELAPAN